MNTEFRKDAHFQPWGPFISSTYQNERITKTDIVVASLVWILTLVNAGIAVWLACAQTKVSKSPLRSTYIWMVWLEMIASVVMGLESYLHLLKLIPPSFPFYFSILFWWCIQVQLLLQIIINRIRIIVPDRKRSQRIMVGAAVFVTAINISVFFIWIPARLQISRKYHIINEYWDRTEKSLYLIVDASLNWYFLKTVKANLIANGLTKYNKLVRFNQRIVLASLLMDVMIIAAMSIPNSFVYIQFHPLAYLVKLNIEMTMANLIKRIAVSTSRRTGRADIADEFKSSENISSSNKKSTLATGKHGTAHELGSIVQYSGITTSFTAQANQIKATKEVTVTSAPSGWPRRGSEVEITGGQAEKQNVNVPGIIVEEIMVRAKSSASSVDMAESVQSVGVDMAKRIEESDDETALVGQSNTPGWGKVAWQ